MRFVTFQTEAGAPEPGVIVKDSVARLQAAGYHDLLSVIAAGEAASTAIARSLDELPRIPLASVKLRAPIPRPPKIICVGLNYMDHAAETKAKLPGVPTIFTKFPTAVIGPGDNIVLPKASAKPDYEAELAFVIGRGGRYIDAARWREHVFGYTNFNDVSARDYQMAASQWTMGKSFDTFAPMGPWIVSADEVPDPHALDIRCIVSGEELQSSNTGRMIFRIPELIAFLSSVFTLEPGDVVATGTPSGVGFVRNPPRYLRAGDEVAVSITGLGELRNPVIAESGTQGS